MKKFKTIVVRENIIDSDGDIFPAKELKKFHKKKVKVYNNFDHKEAIGSAKIKYEPGVGCLAEIEITDDFVPNGMWPVIGFSAKSKMKNEFNGCELREISLCNHRNSDPGILPISNNLPE